MILTDAEKLLWAAIYAEVYSRRTEVARTGSAAWDLLITSRRAAEAATEAIHTARQTPKDVKDPTVRGCLEQMIHTMNPPTAAWPYDEPPRSTPVPTEALKVIAACDSVDNENKRMQRMAEELLWWRSQPRGKP